MNAQKINTDFDTAENLAEIVQFQPQQEILALPIWCNGKMLLSPTKNWQIVENRWKIPLCDSNEAKNCLISAQQNLQTWQNLQIQQRLTFLIDIVDLLQKNLYAEHFVKNFFTEVDRKPLLNFFTERLRTKINFYLNSYSNSTLMPSENSSNNAKNICCLVLNNIDYQGGEQQFFSDFADIFVKEIFVLGKTLIINPSPNLSPLVLAFVELTSRIQKKFPEGVINVLHGNQQIINEICEAFSEFSELNSEKVLNFRFVANQNLKQQYMQLLQLLKNKNGNISVIE